ncbi:MAG: hypothetical protein CL572_06780 [Alphaproteobacteria bacterium]|nr:hypothetical protein [Alphaproteobacteria bacterium]
MRFLKLFLFLCLISKQINSANLNVIRDAETENLFKEIAIELMKGSKFDANKINFFIDNQDFINAFVLPGQKIFLTTRLLIESKKIDDIAGVIGHEIGHIVGGHFSQRTKAMEKTSMINIISTILAAGALAAGAGPAGTAILMGGQNLGTGALLSFSRTQESLADQTAIRLLKESGFSLQGMLNIFEILERNESLKKINPYFLTHPLSSERKKVIKLNLQNQNLKSFKSLNLKFSLVKAKVNGFFLEDTELKSLYPNLKSIQSLYAYALRNYKVGKINKAIELVDKCLKIDNKNPYFHELKGQILFENGKSYDAVSSFRKAIELKPNEKSFNLFLAKSLYHSQQEKSFSESIDLLWQYIKNDNFPYEAWHYLGLNYGKMKKFDLSSYALAEKYLLVNELKNAKMHIQRVKKISKDRVLLNKLADLEKEIRKREKK